MARLNVAVEALCELGANPDPLTDTRTWLSIFVTNKDLEPVSGLKQSDFGIRALAPVWGQGDLSVPHFLDDAASQLPGVYLIKLQQAGTPFGNTYGVKVRRPKPLPQLADAGFGMATAVRGPYN